MKRLCAIFLVAIMLTCLFGCGSSNEAEEPESPISLVIIVGKHANARLFSRDQLERNARPLIERSIHDKEDNKGYHSEAQVFVIACDGDPESIPVTLNGKNILSCDSTNSSKFEDRKEKIVDDVIEFLLSDELKANDPEVDLLKALRLAQKLLNTTNDTERHILVLDTGITTTGYLNMRLEDKELLSNDTKSILSAIQDGLPNLENIQVTFLGLGNVGGAQPELVSNTAEKALINLWTEIIESTNGTITTGVLQIAPREGQSLEYDEDLYASGTGYPPVSTIHFPQVEGSIKPKPIQIKTTAKTDGPKLLYKLETTDLGFMPNSAEFYDISEAYYTLNLIQDDIEGVVNDTDCVIYIVGSIAKTSPDKTDRSSPVSADRANAIADILKNKYNVPENRIVVIDAGVTEFSWRNAPEDDGPKQANRVVAIISANVTDLVDELRQAGYIK